jgi:hypothetical protein
MQATDESDQPKLMVKCPACGSSTPYQGNPYRPFCSRACKGSDLLNWSTGAYQIPGETQAGEEDENE